MAQKVLYETRQQTEFAPGGRASVEATPTTKAVLPPEPRWFFTVPAGNTAGKAWEEGDYYYMVYSDRVSPHFLGYAGVENPTPDQIHPTIQGALT